MNRTHRPVVITALVLALTIGFGVGFAADTRQLYDQYVAAYQAYSHAVARQAPAAEVERLLQAYRDANLAYAAAAGRGPTAGEGATAPVVDSGSGASVAPTVTAAADAQSSSVTPQAPLLDLGSTASMPAELREILDGLANTADRARGADWTARLQAYVAAQSNSPFINRAKYELARALDWFKGDKKGAESILTSLSTSTSTGPVGAAANQYVRYLKAIDQHYVWKKTLNTVNADMNARYQKYRDVSWLAFPIKGYRYLSYLHGLSAFKKAQKGYEKFQLEYEAAAAPFVPPPEIAFGQINKSEDRADDTAQIRLLNANTDAWYARWSIIAGARKSIDIQYFIIYKDVFGMSLLGLLQQKAREGVKIRLMMDDRASMTLTYPLLGKDFLEELAAWPNLKIRVYNPLPKNLVTLYLDVRNIMSSNHDKIVVVDDEYSIVGGRNIANEYLCDPQDDPAAWRDCDVLVRSKLVAEQMTRAFDDEFNRLRAVPVKRDLVNVRPKAPYLDAVCRAMDAHLRGRGPWLPADKSIAKDIKKLTDELATYRHETGLTQWRIDDNTHECPVKLIDKNSIAGAKDDITDELMRMIDGSRCEIVMQNPYVTLTPRAEAALKRAAQRGVKIFFHTNSGQTTDSFPTEAIFRTDYLTYLRDIPTCRIFAYIGKRQLHAKTFVFDRKVAVVGTYNMDFLSEAVNSELVAAINSPSFAEELRAGIFADIDGSSVEYRLPSGNDPGFGPKDIPTKNKWLVEILRTMRWLKPLI